jgi:NAD-dependent dihydropyrimidine dehydrogenase PreA subunit
VDKWLPIIDTDRCSGCGACVNLCAPVCLGIPVDHAVLEYPDVCKSEGRCVRICPQGAIRMGWVPFEGAPRRGQFRRADASGEDAA